MRLTRLTLQNFRNIAFADLRFEGWRQFFIGANGQGKTNLLEAAGFLTALRSFRASDADVLIAHGWREAAIAAEFETGRGGTVTRVVVTLRPGGKEVVCDGERMARLADYLGRFPTVVFSSQDQQLVRGAPGLRRRWLDLALAATSADYLDALTRYYRALEGRNRLLKRQAGEAELAAFEAPLAEAAARLSAARKAGVEALSPQVAAAYAAIGAEAESASLALVPDVGSDLTDVAEWREHYVRGRARDRQFRTTLSGPHRDDLDLRVGGRSAKDYGSEGQQRTLALALRLAQVEHIRVATGQQPVLLADDVLGELDPGRRRRFWAALGGEHQVMATGTEPPAAELGDWELFRVRAGVFARESAGS